MVAGGSRLNRCQTAPPETRPLVVGRPREPAPVVEQNLGKYASDRAAGPGRCREVSHPGAHKYCNIQLIITNLCMHTPGRSMYSG